MNSNRTIDIIVSPQGDISINAIGFKGADCEKATGPWRKPWERSATGSRNPNTTPPRLRNINKGSEHEITQPEDGAGNPAPRQPDDLPGQWPGTLPWLPVQLSRSRRL
jgi:hypothetical protein